MPEYIIHIKDGAITNTLTVRRIFDGLADGKYLCRVDSIKKRTLPQNAYYHGVVVPMVKDGLRAVGYNEVRTNEDAHEILKQLFLKKSFKNENTDEAITVPGSTRTLTTVEFNAFLEDVWQWASQYLNIVIPAPNEQLVMFSDPMIVEYDSDSGATIIEGGF